MNAMPWTASFEIVALVDDYVFGHVMRAREGAGFSGDDSGAERRLEAVLAYVTTQLATGEFPTSRRSPATIPAAPSCKRPG